jgi:hypothetical protein
MIEQQGAGKRGARAARQTHRAAAAKRAGGPLPDCQGAAAHVVIAAMVPPGAVTPTFLITGVMVHAWMTVWSVQMMHWLSGSGTEGFLGGGGARVMVGV